MIKLNVHTKSGKSVTLNFNFGEYDEANGVLIQYSDWLAVCLTDGHGGMAGDAMGNAPLIDYKRGTRRVIIHFSQIEFMEAE